MKTNDNMNYSTNMNQNKFVILVSILCRNLYASNINMKQENIDCRPTARQILVISRVNLYCCANCVFVELLDIFNDDDDAAGENII